PVELYPSADATALGVGAFARLGNRGAATPTEAVGGWSPSAAFEPKMSADEATERLARWHAAALALAERAEGSTATSLSSAGGSWAGPWPESSDASSCGARCSKQAPMSAPARARRTRRCSTLVST